MNSLNGTYFSGNRGTVIILLMCKNCTADVESFVNISKLFSS